MVGLMLRVAALGAALLLSSAPAAAKGSKAPAPVLIRLDPALQTLVVVSQRVWAKEHSRGLAALLPSIGAMVVQPGTYPVEFAVRTGDREWLLVPYRLRSNGQERSPDTSSSVVSGCTSRFRRFLALDRQTSQFESRVWRLQQHSCANEIVAPTTEGEWSREIRFEEAGLASARGFQSTEEAMAAAVEAKRRHEEAAREMAEAQRAADALEAPRKRQIGARLCRQEAGWQFIAFTERVSPDNGKLQIRVVEQHRVGSPALRASDFREQILWDVLERWRLCE